MMRKKNLSSKVFHTLLAMSCVYLGGTFALPTTEAEELTDKTYTGSMSAITSGNHTVSAGDVIIDASGYTGNANYQYPLFNTQNGNINVDIARRKNTDSEGVQRQGRYFCFCRSI